MYEIIEKEKTYQVKDLEITAKIKIKIDQNGTEVFDEDLEQENDLIFFREFRRKKGLLSPNEIKSIREKYCLSQKNLAIILGWGEKTITRYENGSIQDASHNTTLKMVKRPKELYDIFMLNHIQLKEKLSIDDFKTIHSNLLHKAKLDVHFKADNISIKDFDFSLEVPEQINSVVNYMIKFFNSNESVQEKITHLKVQKLLYYIQGLFLAFNGKPLFLENIVAWEKGPVVDVIYYGYKSYGYNPLPYKKNSTIIFNNANIEKTLDKILLSYGKKSAQELVELTHKETPWEKTKHNEVISHNLMKEYFTELYDL